MTTRVNTRAETDGKARKRLFIGSLFFLPRPCSRKEVYSSGSLAMGADFQVNTVQSLYFLINIF